MTWHLLCREKNKIISNFFIYFIKIFQISFLAGKFKISFFKKKHNKVLYIFSYALFFKKEQLSRREKKVLKFKHFGFFLKNFCENLKNTRKSSVPFSPLSGVDFCPFIFIFFAHARIYSLKINVPRHSSKPI